MLMTFKTRIYPTKKQREYFHKAFGIRRFVWNWGLDEYLTSLNNGITKSNYDLQKQLNNTLVKDKEYEWLSEVNSMVRQESLKDLSLSLKRYHDEQRKARMTTTVINTEKYKPKFKSKKRDIMSFRYNNKGNPVIPNGKKHFYLTTVKSKKNRLNIKCAESLLFLKSKDVRFCEITISKQADKYYLSISYERTNYKKKRSNHDTVGIDMGMKTSLTCYDSNGNGWKCHQPSKLFKQEKHTEKLNKQLSRKVYGSNRYKKTLLLLQKSYIKENNIKKEFREQITTMLVKNYKTIKIEDFNTKHNTLKNINRTLSRLGKYIFIERLKQKASLYNTELIFISGKPTTQTCSKCGYRHMNDEKLTLEDREFVCKSCGHTDDRDYNAAKNILNLV